ncbi:MAG: TonB-dependent receptor [Inhella sp.]|jgi:iron complex outermembrane receptor protein|uniref:TonB-dependent receptor plug domain-containing protein n=1 Tax=Inhella sp. TaxID=1921806 RepID=UPI0022C95BAE|nr:TonB-dependent receptor [Inhella sp.]MCZ8236518.1 TonB-dependent receptor [Inhella sp.]
MFKTTPLAAALTAVFAVSLPAFAQQEVSDDRQAQPQALDRVEVRGRQATETELRRRQPVAKQIYGRDDLDKYGDTQLSDVLKRLPGINVSGGQLRMRGLGGAYTQILVNGEQAPPGFSLDNLNPAQVERLEVTKAPTADQSAQAIAGTLNIILKDAPRVVQKDLRLGLAYNAERPVVNGGFTYGDRKGGIGLVLPISFYQWRVQADTASERFTPSQTLPQGTRRRVSEGEDIPFGRGFNVSPRVSWKLGDDETLTLQGFFVSNRFRNRGDAAVTEDVVDPAAADRAFIERTRNQGTFSASRLSLQYNNRFDEDRKVELRAQAGRGGADFDFDYQAGALNRRTTGEGRNGNVSLTGKYSQYWGEDHTITTGVELERRTRDEQRRTVQNGVDLLPGFEGQPFDATITRTAAYVQDEWEINKQWSAYVGLRNERIRVQSEGTGSSFTSSSNVLTPLLHLNYKFDPKGRDLIRASLTRSYKAPDVQQLIARPTINTDYPTNGTNTTTAPDRVGNPNLKPELATGLDIAWEAYLSGGGMVSVSVFHRRITGLIRSGLALQTVPWASAPRWVAMPINLSRASTTGMEFEVKGRAGELMPSLFEPTLALNLRAALSVYTSKVKDVPGPDNRLEQQQPWSLSLGADYRMKSLPVSLGVSVNLTPEYEVQQTELQRLTTGQARGIDAFAMWNLSKIDTLRLSVNGLAQPANRNTTAFANGDFSRNERQGSPWWSLNWEHKF